MLVGIIYEGWMVMSRRTDVTEPAVKLVDSVCVLVYYSFRNIQTGTSVNYRSVSAQVMLT